MTTTATATTTTTSYRQDVSNKVISVLRVTGKKASLAGQKAKLGADMVLLNQKIRSRKQQFGVELYECLAGCVEEDPMVLIEHDADDAALHNLQGFFVAAYKNNRALLQKRATDEGRLEALAERRRVIRSRHGGTLEYEVPADSVGERILNAPKLARIKAEETRVKGNMASVDQQVLHRQYQFGLECYEHLLELELTEDSTPVHPEVRTHYQSVRWDMEQFAMIKDEKVEDRELLEEEREKI